MNKPLFKLTLCVLFSVSVCFSAQAGIVVLNGLSHENTAEPGTSYRGEIRIQNAGLSSQSVKIYQKDYWYNFRGESRYEDQGTMERSNSNWISFSPEQITLDTSEIGIINYEVKIPEDASLKGTFWSVIMIEAIVPPDTSAVKGSLKINTAIRYAIQIVTQIGETGTLDLKFLGMEMVRQDSISFVNVAIENTGERALSTILSLELFDSQGNSVGVLPSERRKSFPGTSVEFTIPLENISHGDYNGVLVADCGDDNMFGTNLSLKIE